MKRTHFFQIQLIGRRSLFVLLILLPLLLFAAQPDYLWTTIIEESDMELVVDAEISPDGNIVLLGWTKPFEYYITKYTLEGERMWTLSFSDSLSMYDIHPITNRDGEIIVHGGKKGDFYSACFFKISSSGVQQCELSFDNSSRYIFPSQFVIDDSLSDYLIGVYNNTGKLSDSQFRCIDWNLSVHWGYDYPDIRSRVLGDDLVLIGDTELILANQRCFDKEDNTVPCSKCERSLLTFTEVTRENFMENTREFEIHPKTSIKQIYRLTNGYLLLGYINSESKFGPLNIYAVRFDQKGDTLWTAIFPEQDACDDLFGPEDAIEGSDGRIYILSRWRGKGSTATAPSWVHKGFLIAELSPAGTELSTGCYGSGEFHPTKILRISDDEMMIVGSRSRDSREFNIFLMRFRY